MGFEGLADFRVNTQEDVLALHVLGHLAHLDINFVADGRDRFYVASRFAMRAGRADGALERLLDALASDGDQSEIIELEDLRRSAIVAQFLFEGLHDALAVAALVHVDEIDDDDAAEIAEADLANDLLDRVHVGFDDGVFEARGLSDILSGIDVDGDQRFGLVDDDVAATLQPDFRFERLVNFFLQAELFEERRFFRVELDAAHQRGLETIGEAENALVFLLGVDPDGGEVGRDLVAQDTLDDVQVVVDQGRSFRFFGTSLDFVPEILQEADVGAEVFFGGAGSGGAHDETALAVFAFADNDALQALALFVGRDLARDAGVVDGRHVDEEAARQCDVAGDASALFAYGFFRDLDENFLTFFQKIADQGHGGVLATRRAAATGAKAASTTASATTIEGRTLGALGIWGGGGRRANFDARIDGAVPAGFGIEKSFGFGLGVFDFGFDIFLFRFFGLAVGSKALSGNRGCHFFRDGCSFGAS